MKPLTNETKEILLARWECPAHTCPKWGNEHADCGVCENEGVWTIGKEMGEDIHNLLTPI